MFEKSSILFMHNLFPLHAGAGEGVGGVDLPIQREGHTRFPKIEASGIKGATKEAFRRNNASITVGDKSLKVNEKTEIGTYPHIDLVFGPDQGDLHSSAIGFSDARLLLYPVPSLKGVFAWVTCPMVLEQFKMDLQRAYPNADFQWDGWEASTASLAPGIACIQKDSNLRISGPTDRVFLQEYPFDCFCPDQKLSIVCKEKGSTHRHSFVDWLAKQGAISGDYFQQKLQQDILILHDDDYRYFVEQETEVITRIRIDPESGIVQQGALFTEEYLPTQCLLYSIVSFAPVFMDSEKLLLQSLQKADEIAEFFRLGLPPYWQLGGNATLGKGMLHFTLMDQQISAA